MRIRAIKDTYGFQGRYWAEGDEGDCPEGTDLGGVFESMETKKEPSVYPLVIRSVVPKSKGAGRKARP